MYGNITVFAARGSRAQCWEKSKRPYRETGLQTYFSALTSRTPILTPVFCPYSPPGAASPSNETLQHASASPAPWGLHNHIWSFPGLHQPRLSSACALRPHLPAHLSCALLPMSPPGVCDELPLRAPPESPPFPAPPIGGHSHRSLVRYHFFQEGSLADRLRIGMLDLGWGCCVPASLYGPPRPQQG